MRFLSDLRARSVTERDRHPHTVERFAASVAPFQKQIFFSVS